MANRIKGITIEIGGNTTKLQTDVQLDMSEESELQKDEAGYMWLIIFLILRIGVGLLHALAGYVRIKWKFNNKNE